MVFAGVDVVVKTIVVAVVVVVVVVAVAIVVNDAIDAHDATDVPGAWHCDTVLSTTGVVAAAAASLSQAPLHPHSLHSQHWMRLSW